jgi:hypothetical protein
MLKISVVLCLLKMFRDLQIMFAAGMHLAEGGKGSNLLSGYKEISRSHNT